MEPVLPQWRPMCGRRVTNALPHVGIGAVDRVLQCKAYVARSIKGVSIMAIAAESVVLGVLCLFDFVSTVWLLRTGIAMEANPVLGFYIQNGGIIAFAGAKVLLTIGPLFAL